MYGIAEFQPQTGTFVKQIVLAACRFYQKHQTGANLKSIHFVIQPNNTECYATFTSTLKDFSPSYAT